MTTRVRQLMSGLLRRITVLVRRGQFLRRQRVSRARAETVTSKARRIRLWQTLLLHLRCSRRAKRLIVYLTPGSDSVSGGVLAISSLYEETLKLKSVHHAEVVLCTTPGSPPMLRYTKFKNRNHIYSLSQVLSYFHRVQNILIHVPEYHAAQFPANLSTADRLALEKIHSIDINLMIANIDLLPSPESVDALRQFGRLTCTTAHQRYCSAELRARLGCPLHLMLTFDSPERYQRTEYKRKDDLLIVSPDQHPIKSDVLAFIAAKMPHLKIQVIANLTYEEFKRTATRAKWALTFGEGLDGYFVQTVFSGGVSFAAYNDRFFLEDFKILRTVYENYDVLLERICADMQELDNEAAYGDYQRLQYDLCSRHYNSSRYVRNVELFYRGEYTFP